MTLFITWAAWSWHTEISVIEAAPAKKIITPNLESFNISLGLPDPNQIFAEVNRERSSKNLSPLVKNAELAKVAEMRAADMSTNHYYAHLSPSGKYYYDLMIDDYGFSCENLGLELSLAAGIFVDSWLQSSSGHRDCMLNPKITQAGYAVRELKPLNASPADTPSYIVVAIHAEVLSNN